MTRSVSVLMPVLNEERSIMDAVDSALSQTGCDVQVVVVDGRSADRTRELVSEWRSAMDGWCCWTTRR